jgi:hypothetical protein
MPYLHKFGPDDIFRNRMETRPESSFSMYSGSIYLDNNRNLGQNIINGCANLYEYNVDRASNLIYPYFIKDGNWLAFPSVSTAQYDTSSYGDIISGSYPLTASISRQVFEATTYPTTAAERDTYATNRKQLISLQNTMNYYRMLSDNYHYTGAYVSGAVNMIQIPSIFFEDGITKGSVSLKFYFTGSLIDEAIDSRKNGELISTMGNTSGSTVGMVLYDQGFVLLTSSVNISDNQDHYAGNASLQNAQWLYYGAYNLNSIGSSATQYPTASLYQMDFKGTNKIPTMMMFAHADMGHVNNSLNPTWVSSSSNTWRSETEVSRTGYVEPRQVNLTNTIQSQYCNYEDSFEKQVFISEIGIYDKEKNLLGIAKMANPVTKKESQDYTFKLKLDM